MLVPGSREVRLIRAASVEGDCDTSPAGAASNLHLVGDVPHDPQAVTGQIGQPARQGRVSGSGRITVVNLTVQRSGQIPYPQSPRFPPWVTTLAASS
jgi:hypothetical protein